MPPMCNELEDSTRTDWRLRHTDTGAIRWNKFAGPVKRSSIQGTALLTMTVTTLFISVLTILTENWPAAYRSASAWLETLSCLQIPAGYS